VIPVYMFLLLQGDSLGLSAIRWLSDCAVFATLYIRDKQNAESGPHAALHLCSAVRNPINTKQTVMKFEE